MTIPRIKNAEPKLPFYIHLPIYEVSNAVFTDSVFDFFTVL
jgi:hypothetical protein